MRKQHIFVLLTLLCLGCAAIVADPPAAAGQAASATVANNTETEYLAMIVEQALMIEALQGEIIALQEGAADYGFVYEVESGQSLWMIADNILGDPYKWITIYTMNPWMGDPDLIYPYQVLILP